MLRGYGRKQIRRECGDAALARQMVADKGNLADFRTFSHSESPILSRTVSSLDPSRASRPSPSEPVSSHRGPVVWEVAPALQANNVRVRGRALLCFDGGAALWCSWERGMTMPTTENPVRQFRRTHLLTSSTCLDPAVFGLPHRDLNLLGDIPESTVERPSAPAVSATATATVAETLRRLSIWGSKRSTGLPHGHEAGDGARRRGQHSRR